MQRTWFKTALINLVIAAVIGALLRFAFVEEVSWLKFQNWLHGHSHVAMLGWVYLALYAFLIGAFLPKKLQNHPFYNRLFWVTQSSVVGMLIMFPIQGYAAGSVGFSTLHILCSYVFVWQFWKHLNHSVESKQSTRFIRAALFFMVLSTFAIWTIPVIIISGNAGSAFYYGAVQFFLHFQFNGWFIFAVLGLFFRLLENKNIELPAKLTDRFFNLLVISCFLTFALAVTWSTPLPILFLTNSIGVIIQLAALYFFLLIIRKFKSDILNLFSGWVRILFTVSLLSFVLKILMQSVVVIPYMGTIGYTIRNYVIGFLHLMLLGMITGFLIGFGANRGYLNLKFRLSKTGIFLFLAGFILSESVLFIQGTMFWGALGFMPKYYEILFGVSVLMPVGLGLLLIDKSHVRA